MTRIILIPKLLNNPFDFSSFENFGTLLLHIAHFDDKLLVFSTFESTFSVLSLDYKQFVL